MANEVLVIGGGFSGLASGVALAGAGCRVRLIEQKPYLGGRARSFVDQATGAVVDNGQHMFMGCYHETIRFLREIGTLDRIRLQSSLALKFLDPPGRTTTLACPNLRAPWHLLAGVLSSASFGAQEKLQVMRFGLALRSGRATFSGTDRLTVDEWLSRLGQSKRLRRNFWDLLCIGAMNENPRIASAALFQRVLRLALFSSPEDSCLGIARVGLSDCYTQAAASYIKSRGGQVETKQSIAALLISKGVCEGVELADGSHIKASTVISAAPWHEFLRFLPKDLANSEPSFAKLKTLVPAPIISINLWFDRPVTDLEFAALRGTTVQWLFNKGKIFGSGKEYVSLVLSGAHEYVSRPKEELIEIALHDLGELLPGARGAKLVHSLVLKERFATFSPNCDSAGARPPARTPIAGLYLAGDWTDTGLPATIEGAVWSGYAAAQAVLQSDHAA